MINKEEFENKNLSEEDQTRMDKLIDETREILAREEAMSQEKTLAKSKDILSEEAGKDIELIEEVAVSFFRSPEFVKELSGQFKEKYGWGESKFQAMTKVLRHAVSELFGGNFPPPDEREIYPELRKDKPFPEPKTRDSRRVLAAIVERDFGKAVAEDISPFIDYFVQEANALVKKERGISAADSGESEDNPNPEKS